MPNKKMRHRRIFYFVDKIPEIAIRSDTIGSKHSADDIGAFLNLLRQAVDRVRQAFAKIHDVLLVGKIVEQRFAMFSDNFFRQHFGKTEKTGCILLFRRRISKNVPTFFGIDIGSGKAFQPAKQQPLILSPIEPKRLLQVAYPDGNSIIVVEFDLVVARKVRFISESAQNFLKKRVDGADIEIGIILQQLHQCHLRRFADFFNRRVQRFCKKIGIRASVGLAGKDVKFLHNAFLHLFRRLVGKGDGKNGAVVLVRMLVERIPIVPDLPAEKQFQKFAHQRECFSRTCRCLIDIDHTIRTL